MIDLEQYVLQLREMYSWDDFLAYATARDAEHADQLRDTRNALANLLTVAKKQREDLAAAERTIEQLGLDAAAIAGELDAVCKQRDQLMGRLNALEWTRPKVLVFARIMEEKLRENDHKGGWENDGIRPLLKRLDEEAVELHGIIARRKEGGLERGIGREAADVANFAMMIADVCGALTSPSQPEPVKAPRMCACHMEEHMVCDICQGVAGKDIVPENAGTTCSACKGKGGFTPFGEPMEGQTNPAYQCGACGGRGVAK